MRLAYFSPLPPARSGIADYSAELLPELAEHLDVEPFVDDGVRVDAELARRFTLRPRRSFPELWRTGRFDAVLYHLGNHPDYHAGISRLLDEAPGIVVLHEAMLHHLVRGTTVDRGDAAGYVEEMRYAYGKTGEAMAQRSLDTGIPLDVWRYPLFERFVDRSLGVIVHNEFTARRVLASRPGTRIVRVPLHLSLGDLPAPGSFSQATLRAELGLPENAFVVASFGFITPAKRLDVGLRAFARLRQIVPDAVYLLVGEVSPHYDFQRVLTPELAPGVKMVGRTELPDFLRHMLAADVAVNLRHPTAGETSAAVIRLLGLGKPVIVTNAGAFAEIPDDCCAKVDLDDTEEELLFTYLLRLVRDEPLRRAMGDNARRHVAAHHTLAGSARAYADFVRETVALGIEPYRPVPPLAPYPREDVFSELVRDTSAELFDLGVEEGDEEALRGVAAALTDLDARG